ncbi:MAG: aldehyde dehydrogenase family protein [Pseudomonadota bacterium]
MSDHNTRLNVAKTYKLFIGGQFPRTESGRYTKFTLASEGEPVNVCRASRKDFRNACVAARSATSQWSATSGYLRGQILYRIAEMLEGRRSQFIDELQREGMDAVASTGEVDAAIDQLLHFSGWTDKHVQVTSAVNPVSSAHFNFSVPEPMGLVASVASSAHGLTGLVAAIAPAITGANTVVCLASESHPLTAISFAEVLHASDVPAGVVNILTGERAELLEHFASHMDVNALVLADVTDEQRTACQVAAADNVKRVITIDPAQLPGVTIDGLDAVSSLQEIKTTWHPVAN